ncbi:hypothetical protein BSKO_04478 [Bryopsis sp. KO-2023]|nr:hypothetical protein BSKO_04478 [Bryopsis sp. KO-2023]
MVDTGEELRSLKEQFVSGHSGTSNMEVLWICLVMPLLAFPASLISSRLGQRFVSHAVEFVLIMVPGLAVTTQVLSYTTWVSFSLLCFGISAMLRLVQFNERQSALAWNDLVKQRRRYLDTFRGVMLAYTCMAILAVDFNVFPRRFAKAETFGTGLMDIGPGMFVLASGMVSKPPAGQSIYRLMRRAGPLILLGSIRLFSVSAADYQVHVGEYGVHWNFFFTLAAVETLSFLIPLRGLAAFVGAVGTLAAHQSALSLGGMMEYVHSSERGTSLIDLNKEGIFSMLGYWSLHLWGAAFGQGLLWTARKFQETTAGSKKTSSSMPRQASKALITWTVCLLCTTLVLYGCALALIGGFEPVSRRACNATYIVWTLGLTSCVVSVCAIGDILGNHSLILHALSKNLLGVFLAANLATGCVNMAVNTLETSNLMARVILGVYMALICAVGWFIGRL